MKKLLGFTLGVLTAVGGFVDIGDLVANSLIGARFGLRLAWVVVGADPSGRVAHSVRLTRPGAQCPYRPPRWSWHCGGTSRSGTQQRCTGRHLGSGSVVMAAWQRSALKVGEPASCCGRGLREVDGWAILAGPLKPRLGS